MDEGIDEFDEIEELTPQEEPEESQQEELQEEPHEEEESSENNQEGDFISELLKSRGIEDSTKIKFENDNGEIEEVDWNSLSNEDKLNILNSSEDTSEENLDDSEIELINAIRQSNLTPAEYIQYLQRSSVENYLQNSQQHTYSIDQYSDEELYVMDLINKSEDITEEEAIEALETAKANDVLFKKQIAAIRNEYRKAEEESIQYSQLQQQQDAQAQYNQFAEQIENSIINFKEFSGCELNMSDEDMQNLYDFVTGYDKAGNNWFSKALRDPESVVQMAWFYLYGEKMIQDMNEYYQKEITNVRKDSFNKGKEAAKKGNSKVVYKPKSNNQTTYEDDLDDF